MGKEIIYLKEMNHRGQRRLRLKFVYDKAINEKVKTIPGRRWSQTKKCWHVPDLETVKRRLEELFTVVKDQEEPKTTRHESKKTPYSTTVVTPSQKQNRKLVYGNSIIVKKENKKWLKAYVPYDKKGWIARVKEIPGRRWNVEEICWHLPYVKETINRLNQIPLANVIFNFDLSDSNNNTDHFRKAFKKVENRSDKKEKRKALSLVQKSAIQALEENMILRRMSYRTIKSYKSHFKNFLVHYNDIDPQKMDYEHIRAYLIFRLKENKISASTQNQIISAIKKYYEGVLGQDKVTYEIERPKKPKQLPKVLSREEVKQLMGVLPNLKHKSILMVVYSGGLRLSELLNLRLTDIDSNRKMIFIKGGKGKKDRYTLISEKAILNLREYYKMYLPKEWLFEGKPGVKYSERSVQNIFKKALRLAGIRKVLGIHSLRHSFATHLYESGVDFRTIQVLLGHSSSRTTEIYTHIAKRNLEEIRNPLDNLDEL